MTGGGRGAVHDDDLEEGARDDGQLFRGAPSSANAPLTTLQISAQRPGDLFAGALQRIRQKVAAIHGSEAVGNEGRRLLTFYLELILKPNVRGSRSELSHHTARQFVTLASAMDALLRGNTAKAGSAASV